MKKLELSDKVASVEMTVTQVGVALAAVHTALEETHGGNKVKLSCERCVRRKNDSIFW